MHTTASVHFRDASKMDEVADASVHLVVTSPPYPMIEMWDGSFASWAPEVRDHLQKEKFEAAFASMHDALATVWRGCYRVLSRGGILCVNIGDATRSVGGSFQLYPNHARVTEACVEIGFHPLPGILWRKTTNKPTKFMGSGMIAPNAYVTLEHEHILIFRKGRKRRISRQRREARYQSAYFWEERNQWFSDVWSGLNGVTQELPAAVSEDRTRSAAFPLDLPLRLIHMYSIYGDTVLDPFWGTGTTSIAAALLRRDSVGYELERDFWSGFVEQCRKLPDQSAEYNVARLRAHDSFIRTRDKSAAYHNTPYATPVITKQEESIQLYGITSAEASDSHTVRFEYQPFEAPAGFPRSPSNT